MLQIPASNLLRLLGRHLPGAGTEPDLPAALLTPAHRGAHQREFSLVIPLKVLALTTANFAAGQPSVGSSVLLQARRRNRCWNRVMDTALTCPPPLPYVSSPADC